MASQILRTDYRRARPLLGTLVEIKARGHAAAEAVEAGFAAIAKVHRLMSRFEPDSDVSRLNAARTGEGVAVNAATLAVLTLATELECASSGAFHCARTLGDVAHDGPTWTIGSGKVCKHVPALFDLGGIAKGYAVDCAIDAMLAASGNEEPDYLLVNAGGDMRHAGMSPAEVLLRDPASPAQAAGTRTLHNAAIASSVAGGLKPEPGAAPRLHPPPGMEALSANAGASVQAPTCMLADGLTKVVLLCRDPNHPLLARHAACTVLYRDGKLAASRF